MVRVTLDLLLLINLNSLFESMLALQYILMDFKPLRNFCTR